MEMIRLRTSSVATLNHLPPSLFFRWQMEATVGLQPRTLGSGPAHDRKRYGSLCYAIDADNGSLTFIGLVPIHSGEISLRGMQAGGS